MEIHLPYPPPKLSPNSRTHFMARARTAKKYKNDCIVLATRPALYDRSVWKGTTRFTVTFHAPDNHRRDMDNAIAAFKYGMDALSFVFGVDDSKFAVTYAWGEPVKGGRVTISPAMLEAA